MKIKLLFFFFFLFQLSAIAQQKLVFNYDTAGNQILRERLCLNCPQLKTQEIVTVDTINLDSKPIKDSSEIQFVNENELRISAYPNPVSDILQVQWVDHSELIPIEVIVYSRDNRHLDQITLSGNQNIQDIRFSRYPTGTYILVVVFTNGQRRSFQIIKK